MENRLLAYAYLRNRESEEYAEKIKAEVEEKNDILPLIEALTNMEEELCHCIVKLMEDRKNEQKKRQ